VLPWSPLAGGWLSGRYRRGEVSTESTRLNRQPGRHDHSVPENVVKLEKVHRLQDLADEAGLSLVHLALAFVLEHPAVTSAIIGPRTMEHLESQLDVVKVSLSREILDRIDEIVPPGTTLNEADRGYAPPALTDASLRRRSA
jgi:aryl-alcohol dehydrogenase-like predicted oxidoreductase